MMLVLECNRNPLNTQNILSFGETSVKNRRRFKLIIKKRVQVDYNESPDGRLNLDMWHGTERI